MAEPFNPDCTRCPRLAEHLARVRETHPDYHARPVAPFGPADARLLIVGLAPGMHGANRTGRAFTGDYAGILLYRTLYDFGFASRPEAVSADDGLALDDCRITNAVKCLPPSNKPTGEEVRTCSTYLRYELDRVPAGGVVLALGGVAHRSIIRSFGLKQVAHRFVHGADHALPGGRTLVDSYHCSRYNTNTGRLTAAMFAAVVEQCRDRLRAQAVQSGP